MGGVTKGARFMFAQLHTRVCVILEMLLEMCMKLSPK